jgi:hypothetical protein
MKQNQDDPSAQSVHRHKAAYRTCNVAAAALHARKHLFFMHPLQSAAHNISAWHAFL